MSFLNKIPFEIGTLPEWLQPLAGPSWPWLMLVLLLTLALMISVFAKRLVRSLARRRYADEKAFEGSGWDLAAPVVQLVVFAAGALLAADLTAVYDTNRLDAIWTGALISLAIIAAAVMFSTWMVRSMRSFAAKAHGHGRRKVDDTVFIFVGSMLRYAIFAVAFLLVLGQFGFQTASLVALVGAIGLALALALQDTLKAVAAGVMLAVFRPFRIGDFVGIASQEGEVHDITPFVTSIKQVDNKVISIANDQVWTEPIVNHTRDSRRRLDLYFNLAFEDDVETALSALIDAAHECSAVITRDETWSGVHTMADWCIKLRLRAWVRTEDFVQARSDVTRLVLSKFKERGLSIPYPAQVEYQVHNHKFGTPGGSEND